MTSTQKAARRGALAACLAVVAGPLGACGGGGTVDLGGFGFTTNPIKKGDGFLVGILVEGPTKGDLEVLEVEARTSPNVTFAGVSQHHLGGGGFESSLGELASLPARVPPDSSDGKDEYSFAVGFRVADGLGAIKGIDVTWKVDGKKKRGHFNASGITCPEPGLYERKGEEGKRCEPEDDRDFEKQTFEKFGLSDDD